MKLPISLPNPLKKGGKQKYILALLLRDEKISALITEEVEGKMKVVGQNEELLTTPLEKLTDEAWLDVLDRTISKAEETLPPDRETHDTVFGVKESWVEEKKIKKDYLLKLKKISEALDLQPIGFLVVNEAITHLLQEEEGAPASAILVDVGKNAVTATLIRGGKILESKSTLIVESLPATVDALLKHFTAVEVFPSRIILFASHILSGEAENPDELAQQFISHHWSKTLPFLHPPQISVLPAGFDAKAVVQGAASQMGFEFLNLALHDGDEIKTYDKPAEDKEPEEKPTKGKKAKDEEAPEEKLTTEEKHLDDEGLPTEDFGFVTDRDVSEMEPPKEKAAIHEKHAEIANVEPVSSFSPHASEIPDEREHTEEESGGNPLSRVLAFIPAISLPSLGAIKGISLKGLKLPPALMGPGRKMLLIPLGILLVLGLLYMLYIKSQTATVTIFLQPNNVTESSNATFSTESNNDFSAKTIAAKTVSADLDGTASTNTTGKKKVGDPAKGSVTLYNDDDSKKQLSAGTTISNDKGLKFTLDKDVTVGSASGDIFSGTKPGTAQVAVTASDLGPDYNIPSGTKFNVSGASGLAAKNDSAFSGGTEKDVTVVAKKDEDKLISDLSKSLQGKALDELRKKVSGDQKLLPFLTQASVTQKKFDKKVDDQAAKVNLTGTVSFEALSYTEKDVQDFAQVVLKDKFGDDLNISDKGITYTVKNEKQKGESDVTATIDFQAGLVPKMDAANLKSRVQGKSVADAETELKQLPQVAEAEIKLSPSLPFIPASLPKSTDKITVAIKLHE